MIKLHKVYYVKNEDLGLENETFGHEVITVKWSKDHKRIKVKTITSIEANRKSGEKRKFKTTGKDIVQLIHDGNIIVLPKKYLNTPKLSGIYTKGIWVDKRKLIETKYNTKVSPKCFDIIGK